jgi:hypothetical protein
MGSIGEEDKEVYSIPFLSVNKGAIYHRSTGSRIKPKTIEERNNLQLWHPKKIKPSSSLWLRRRGFQL